MARCAYCKSLVLFGGVKAGNLTFCNAKCQQGAYNLNIAQQIPEATILQTIQHLDISGCPKCKGPGPVDVHTAHMVWSALVLTSWSSKPQISCRKCGVKSQLGNAALSFLIGWWGFPWGLIMTPIQIVRNFVGMFSNPPHPTPQLKRIISLNMASHMVAQQQLAQKQQAPPPFQSPQS